MEAQSEQVTAAGASEPIYYPPLETPQTIRLIHARRLAADGDIIIKLKHFPLLEGQCPRFTAISYVWGEKKLHPHKVVINGRTCRVLESIFPILTLICDGLGVKKDVLFWIDYLCINQDDAAERAAQVALMGTLYQRAFKTLVWLGDDTPEVRGSLDLLKLFASLKRGDKESWAGQVPKSPEKWDALRHWMRRPW